MSGASKRENRRSTTLSCESAQGELKTSAASLAEPKGKRFGIVLKEEIKKSFGTGRAFALAIGVTEGRVSQLQSGAESIAAATLEQILAAFDDLGTQERLHTAWMRTFAPSPLELTSALEGEALASRLLGSFSELLSAGRAKSLLTTFQQTFPLVPDLELRLRMLRAQIDLALYLERPSLAQELSRKLLEEAQGAGSKKWIATALFTGANAARLDKALPIPKLVKLHEAFASYLQSWTPASEEAAVYESLRQASIRDRALTLLAAQEHGAVRPERLQDGVQPLRKLLDRTDNPHERAIGLEVLGRLLTAQGALFAAEDCLDEASEASGNTSYDHQPKVRLLHARILIARGELDAASKLINLALEDCFAKDNRHHEAVAEQLKLRNT